jgi:hypothetical protein
MDINFAEDESFVDGHLLKKLMSMTLLNYHQGIMAFIGA